MRQVGRVDPTALDWAGWRLLEKRIGYECWMRYDERTGEIKYRELYDDSLALRQAELARQHDDPLKGSTETAMRRQFVAPESMLAQSIIEGWHDDMDYWRKIARDSDNRALRTTDERI